MGFFCPKSKIKAHHKFTYNDGWRTEKHVRAVADVNGDGKADIIGFGNNAVNIALGKSDGTFGSLILAQRDFDYSSNWRVEKHVREVADVNGDGRADIVGFGEDRVLVALGQSNGTFGAPIEAQKKFTYNDGWRTEKHVRAVADVNGDGKADIIGFGNNAVNVSLGKSNGTFGSLILIHKNFDYSSGWRVEKHVREVADVNGDGKADLVGFGEDGVYVGLSKQ